MIVQTNVKRKVFLCLTVSLQTTTFTTQFTTTRLRLVYTYYTHALRNFTNTCAKLINQSVS